jgi:hypothetical protein
MTANEVGYDRLPEIRRTEMDIDGYCKVFIDSDKSKENLIESIFLVTESTKKNRSITTKLMEIDVFNNSIFRKSSENQSSFVEWPYYLEIEPVDAAVSWEDYISSLRSLVVELRHLGFNVVASCDFEDQLAE